MKIFQSVCKFYRNASIQTLSHSDYYHNFRFYYWKYLIYIVLPLGASISAMAYFLFKAHSIVEHADSFYVFSTGLANAIITTISIWKISNIFQLIEKFEEFIEKSELLILSSLDKMSKHQ